MAGNLAKAGFDVVGYNRTPDRRTARRGGRPGGARIAEAVRGRRRRRHDGARLPRRRGRARRAGRRCLANATPGTLVIDFSSIRPDVSAGSPRQGAEHGLRVLDAPVSGGEAGRDRGHAVDHGRRRGARTSTAASRSSMPSARPSSTSARAAPARPSRPPTSSSSPATSSWSPRRSSSSRPTASTPTRRSKVLGRRARRQRGPAPQGARTCSPGDFEPGLPGRPAPQGHGHRHRRRPRGRRGHPARRRWSPS